MAGSIICGVDDSDSAKGAARFARGLSGRLGLELVFVRVVEAGSSGEEISAAAKRLARLSECTTDVDCGAGWVVDVGHPADRLIAAAADEGASLIVVGATGPRSSLLGSISAEVSRRAPCPVVVVPPGADTSGNSNGGPQAAGRTAGVGLGSAVEHPAAVTGDSDADEFAGGIVRFSLGGERS